MTATATIGTTSFAFRYLLADPAGAPSIETLVRRTREAGLEALQVCENARPMALGPTGWRAVVAAAQDLNVALHLGCMTLDLEELARHLDRAAMIPGSRALRLILEDESGAVPSRDRLARFLDGAVARAAAARITLVIENHFHVPCRALVELTRRYRAEEVAYCIDSANSLRNWESAEQVFDLLEDRAAFYHLKDYRVRGSNVGFQVTGAPLGEGDLDLDRCLDRIAARHRTPLIFVENWVPASGDRAVDVAADADWLARSVGRLRRALAEAPERRRRQPEAVS